MKKLFAIILASSLITACTVTPEKLTDSQPSFDGNVQNSGLIGFTADGFAILTPHAHDRYNALVKTYGKKFIPALRSDVGCVAYTNGTWLIDKEHLVHFETMNRWRKSGL